MQEQKETFRQDPSQKAKFQNLYQIFLLFREQGRRPSAKEIRCPLEERFGEVDLVADVSQSLTTFAIRRYVVEYKDKQCVPAQVLMADYSPLDSGRIGVFERSQFWDCRDGSALLDSCSAQIMLSDFMAAALPYPERCELLTGWLEAALSLFPDCAAVWIPASGKLLTPDQIRANPCEGKDRFLYFGVNARFFTVEGSDDLVVDTLGLYALGLPDVQYHFHGLDPNAVVNHAYNAASYLFCNNAPIKSGETIDGLSESGIDRGVQWRCQYELSLIQPEREVMDICPGEYASGGRKDG